MTKTVNKQFQDVRDWKAIRGVGESSQTLDKRLQTQFQRVQQEVTEIHEAIVLEDWEEFQDAIGDTIVTLINIADIAGYNAEDCLAKAFDVIKNRKGITTEASDFIRYGKLSDELKKVCDEQQGSPGNEYFTDEMLQVLEPKDFKE